MARGEVVLDVLVAGGGRAWAQAYEYRGRWHWRAYRSRGSALREHFPAGSGAVRSRGVALDRARRAMRRALRRGAA